MEEPHTERLTARRLGKRGIPTFMKEEGSETDRR